MFRGEVLGVKGVGKGLGVIFRRLLELSLQSNLLSIFNTKKALISISNNLYSQTPKIYILRYYFHTLVPI